PRVELQAELLDQTVVPVGAGEAHREGDQLGGDLALGPRPADRAAVDELDLAQVQPLHVAVRVALEVGGGDGVDPLAALLVRRRHLVQHGEGRPRLGRRVPLLAGAGHDLQLGDGGGALTVGGPHAVGAGVTAADHDDVLALGGDRRGDVVALLHLVGQRQVLHGLVDALELAAGHRKVARGGRADRQDDGVVALAQRGGRHVAADLDAGAELGALRAHLLDAAVDVPLLHLELGDAVPQQAADAVGPLVDGDGVAGPGQLLGGGQAGRAGADDGDGLAGQPLGDLRGDVTGLPRLVDDGDLDVLDGDRRLVDAEHARRLAGGRAQPPGELREVVRRVQAIARRRPVPAVGVVVPLGDEVAQRAAVVAERDAAVHAPARLLADDGQQRAGDVDLVPVPDALLDRAGRGEFAAVVQKALRISH